MESRDPGICLEQTAMWMDNLPETQQPADDGALTKADGKIADLVESQQKIQFEADCLALVRDASQLASLYREEQQSERSARLAKVMHLKQENGIGGNLVAQFMLKNCNHFSGPKADLTSMLDQVQVMKRIFWIVFNSIISIEYLYQMIRLNGSGDRMGVHGVTILFLTGEYHTIGVTWAHMGVNIHRWVN